jgi:hypothetical protein
VLGGRPFSDVFPQSRYVWVSTEPEAENVTDRILLCRLRRLVPVVLIMRLRFTFALDAESAELMPRSPSGARGIWRKKKEKNPDESGFFS